MSEKLMHNAWEKLSSSRRECPGLSEEVYALADYISLMVSDTVFPKSMLIFLLLSMEDIRTGKNIFRELYDIPEYVIKHKSHIIAKAVYFPQIIDAIADEEFAKEFRSLCKEVLKFDPPKI